MSENAKKNIRNLKSHSSTGLKKIKFVILKNKTAGITDTGCTDNVSDRLKKRKQLNKTVSEYTTPSRVCSTCHCRSHPRLVLDHSMSALSTNFSHYELLRNLSAFNCHSGGSFSAYGTASDMACNSSAALFKRELLEKYFQSAEKWTNKKYLAK